MSHLLEALRTGTPLPDIFIQPTRRPESKWDLRAQGALMLSAAHQQLRAEAAAAFERGPDGEISSPMFCSVDYMGPKRATMPVLEAFADQIDDAEMRKVMQVLAAVSQGRGGDADVRLLAQAVIAEAADAHAVTHAEFELQRNGF